jgi:uncharacterized small protein (DUF1192 family)
MKLEGVGLSIFAHSDVLNGKLAATQAEIERLKAEIPKLKPKEEQK